MHCGGDGTHGGTSSCCSGRDGVLNVSSQIHFGVNLDPVVDRWGQVEAIARIADQAGLSLVAVQDHAYNPQFGDTWTLLTAIALRTEHVHIMTNVATLALRPLPILAKSAATLDRLSGGRVELGLGAGAFGDGITAMGGPRWSPAQGLAALEDALRLCRLFWEKAGTGEAVTYRGKIFQVTGLQFGPAPARPIPLWLGAIRPRSLRLAGELADGITILTPYVQPELLPTVISTVEAAARAAGRDPRSIRRLYNLLGVLDLPGSRKPRIPRSGFLSGSAETWAEAILRFIQSGMDTFVFWPVAGDYVRQTEHFVDAVLPRVHSNLR